MARKARWLGLLATYRELPPRERDVLDRALQNDPQARALKRRFDEQDALLASLETPRLSPAVRERIMAATVARHDRSAPVAWRPVLATVVILIVLLTAGGTGLASAESLPGEALYPIKRAGERVRLALTLRDQERARYTEYLGEVRRQEVTTLLDLGRSGVDVEFEGPLERMPTGEWHVAGVPVELPEGAGEVPPIAAGSPVRVAGAIGLAEVQVHTIRVVATPAAPDTAPTGPHRTPGPPSQGAEAESEAGGPPEGVPTRIDAGASDHPGGGQQAPGQGESDQDKRTPPGQGEEAPPGQDKETPPDQDKESPPGQDKGPGTPAAPGTANGNETGPANQGQGSADQDPDESPGDGANKGPDGHPDPTRRPPDVGPPDNRGTDKKPADKPDKVDRDKK